VSDLERLQQEMLVELARCGGRPTRMCTSADGELVAYFGSLRIALDPDDQAVTGRDTIAGATISCRVTR